MTDDEYEQLARKFGLASPQQLAGPSPQLALESLAAPTVSNVPALSTVSGRPSATPTTPTSDTRAQGLTTQDLSDVATPTRISFDPSGLMTVATPTQASFFGGEGKGTPADLNRLIDYQIKDRQQRYDEQQANLPKALATFRT